MQAVGGRFRGEIDDHGDARRAAIRVAPHVLVEETSPGDFPGGGPYRVVGGVPGDLQLGGDRRDRGHFDDEFPDRVANRPAGGFPAPAAGHGLVQPVAQGRCAVAAVVPRYPDSQLGGEVAAGVWASVRVVS